MTSSRRRPFQPSTTLATISMLTLCLAGGATPARADQASPAKSQATTVHCGGGESITRALRRAEPGETIHVRGICRERVVITKPVTLDGGGSAVIDGAGLTLPPPPGLDPEFDGLIVVVGVTNVNLVGLTVRNGASAGIVALQGSRRGSGWPSRCRSSAWATSLFATSHSRRRGPRP